MLRSLLISALITLLAACAFPGPEVAVEQLIEAAQRGDREAYLACFTARSRPIIELTWALAEELNPPLAVLAANDDARITRVSELGRVGAGPEQAVVSIREGDLSTVVALRREGGMWRVDLQDSQLAAGRSRW